MSLAIVGRDSDRYPRYGGLSARDDLSIERLLVGMWMGNEGESSQVVAKDGIIQEADCFDDGY